MQSGGFGPPGGNNHGQYPGGSPGAVSPAGHSPYPQPASPQQPQPAPYAQQGGVQQPQPAPYAQQGGMQQPQPAPYAQQGGVQQPPYGGVPSPGMPQAGAGPYPGMPAGAAQYPGVPGGAASYPGMAQGAAASGMSRMAGNPFGQAQQALGGARGTMKLIKSLLIGGGGLLIVAGIVLVFVAGVVTGLSIAISGVVLAGVALVVLPQFAGMLGSASAMVDGFAAKAQLAQTGIPASGRLLQVEQTGRLVNFNPEVRAMVEVQHPRLGVYHTQTTAIVPQIAIPRAQPGAQVQVRINPQNQHDIALVF